MDSLNALLQSSGADTNRLNIYMKLCKLCDISENLKYADPALKETGEMLLSANNLRLRKRLLKYKTHFIIIKRIYYDHENDYARSTELTRELFPLYMELGDTSRYEGEYSQMIYYLIKQQRVTDAFDSLTKRLKYYEDIGVKDQIAYYQAQIARMYITLNNPRKAIEYFEKSLHNFEQLNSKIDIAASLSYLALQYNEINQPEKALEANLKSLELFEKEGNSNQIFRALFGISTNYLRLRNREKALEYNEKCLMIAEKENSAYLLHWIYVGRADLFKIFKDYQQAEISALKSYDIARKANEKAFIKSSASILTEVYLTMRKYDLAIRYGMETEQLAKEQNDIYTQKSAADMLYRAYSASGKFENALKYYVVYNHLEDSIAKIEKQSEIEKMELKFEFEKSEAKKKTEQDKKDALAEEEKQQQAILRNSFIGGFILLLLVVAIIFRSYKQKQRSNVELALKNDTIALQKHLVEEKQKEIIESITYAKRLQEAILPPREFINKYVPTNFVLYKPKDLVAGDFYWAETIGDLFFIAAADSTGHGVPGAIVSVVCSNALNRAVKEFNCTETGRILDKTRELVLETFARKDSFGEKSTDEVKDGMDISLLCIDVKHKLVYWSGANNPLWYIYNNELTEIKADKQPIGKSDYVKPFTTHQIEYKKDTTFYLFTDGFADQFGGPGGKKFKYKQFSELLLKNNTLSGKQQATLINDAFSNWKGDLEQVDDVCVIGIKI